MNGLQLTGWLHAVGRISNPNPALAAMRAALAEAPGTVEQIVGDQNCAPDGEKYPEANAKYWTGEGKGPVYGQQRTLYQWIGDLFRGGPKPGTIPELKPSRGGEKTPIPEGVAQEGGTIIAPVDPNRGRNVDVTVGRG